MKKILLNSTNQPVGVVGEYTGYLNYYVGDSVEVYTEQGARLDDSIILKIRGRYVVYGWNKTVEEMHEANRIQKYAHYDKLKRELVNERLLKLVDAKEHPLNCD